MSSLIGRNLTGRVEELLRTFRVIVLGGARQVGKTTLARDLLWRPDGSNYFAPYGSLSPTLTRLNLDDPATLSRAMEDPVGLLEALPRPVVIDEFQRAGGGLLLAVTQLVDADRARGQLLLTGSANYLADRSVSETLAGRVGRSVLWPLSMGERIGVRETFVEHLFNTEAWPPPALPEPLTRAEVVERVLEGGYPEIVTEGLAGRARRDWFDAYTADVVSREALRPLMEVRLERELRNVFRLLAARTSQELVIADIATDSGLNRNTVNDYIALLEALYLVVLVPAWATSATTRAKRRPKILLADIGLAADLCGAGQSTFDPGSGGALAGALFESYVLAEIHKQVTWSRIDVDLAHFRDRNGAEIDLIVEERRRGWLAGIEVKLTSTPLLKHARHLATLRDRLPDRFRLGLLIHAGKQVLPLGDRLWAVPVSALWRSDHADVAA